MQAAFKKQWVLFCYAMSFFSRLPIPKSINFKAFPFHLGNAYFPVVGVIYALVCFVVYYLAQGVFDNTISVIFMLLAGLLLTGGFHEDGLADCCDGFGGGYNKKQRLTIMKDSQIGTYGTLGLIILFAFKMAVLSGLAMQDHWIFLGGLINAAVLSRFSGLCLIQTCDYARGDDSSKSKSSSHRLPQAYFLSALLFSVLLSLFSLIWVPLVGVLLAIVLIMISTLLCRRYFIKNIGGYSGDCLGLLQQVNELIILLLMLALLT